LIIYQGTKSGFLHDTDNHDIEDVVSRAYLATTGKYVPHAEIRSWRESLGQMAKVLRDDDMPADMGVGIEYGIPQTTKRIDFVLSGLGLDGSPHLIVVELKQWSSSRLSDKDGIVIAQRGGASEREGAHPCYQAWSYAALLEGFNEAVHEGGIDLRPCAYLHNYIDDGIISHPHYAPYIEKAPLFLRGDEERQRLRDFIKQHVKYGDNAELIYKVENGRIRPSKMLADSLVKMLKGNREFVLVDDQKVVYETALAITRGARHDAKQVAIVKGGPGTGKSVVAINLLVELTKLGLVTKYVSKNAAPRSVYKEKLKGSFRQVEISNLFAGSGGFTTTEPDVFDALVVDEAHRLNQFSGLYGNLGENQIKEVITSAKSTILFVDDDQVVTLNDIGHSSELERWARDLGAHITLLELASQFRCNGSDGYLAWLDNLLEVRETANVDFDPDSFDFRVIESPVELHALIAEKNKTSDKARVVAGYCWDWASKKNPDAYDIVIPEYGYKKQWNLGRDGGLWLITPGSIDEVGCIHTCQGLEMDYVGVIVGTDFLARDGRLLTVPGNRSKQDRSIRGYKTLMKSDPDGTHERVDAIIRNTYRTLMTRGMKGCYIFCVDAETQEYFKKAITKRSQSRLCPGTRSDNAATCII
jgi:DUF2075 family protein